MSATDQMAVRRRSRRVACGYSLLTVALASAIFVCADVSFAMGFMASSGAGMRSGAGMARMPAGRDMPRARVPGRGGPHRYVGRPYPRGWSGPSGGNEVVVVSVPRKSAKTRKQAKKATTTAALRSGFFLPPAGETRFVPDEVILGIGAEVPELTLGALAARHSMTREETQDFPLTGRRMHRWRLAPGGSVTAMIRGLAREPLVASAQPNYLYSLQQDTSAKPEPMTGDPAQYVIGKLRLLDAHRLATGARVPVAVIDSGIDDTQPELAGAIAAKFDTLPADEKPQPHGTEMAGAIAAHGRLLGVAPRASLLAVRAFSATAGGGEGTTFRILRGLDWAAGQGARVINMSFAGPQDPALAEALAKARKKGIVLVAAAGNAGPKSPPLFPAADSNVIAVTATDVDDKLFAQANRGDYIAIAAPGVDILVAAPDANVTFTSGTSVAAAHVSGLAALLIETKPSLSPDDVRKLLASSARKLAPKPHAAGFGAGLADALAAVTLAAPAAAKSAAGEQAAGQ